MFSQKTIDHIEAAFQRADMAKSIIGSTLKSLSETESICLKFFYAYMPVSDLASYDVSLFLDIIRQTLKVREMDLYHTNIPDEIFLNYVLHYRVNNENIEFNREIFFNELYPRIKGKTMEEAALEVNYWCLEKATYKPTNPRTVSPLTLIKNAKGRCGEESTFTVSALRSAGIPARQIYTPRWAHCDSNHAWVEVYIDGRWRFLGACEPEPVLDKGWFSGPAARGMLIHTRIFSDMASDDEITSSTGSLTELNLTSSYADTRRIKVNVANAGGKQIKVRFEIPNYCELYPIAVLKTDDSGSVSLTTGMGDLYIHVTDGERFLARKVDARRETDITFDFDKAVKKETSSGMLKFVPPAGKPENGSSQPDAVHEERIKQCNNIRSEYEKTFINEETGKNIAKQFSDFHDDIVSLLIDAKGNHGEIEAFLRSNSHIPLKYKVLLLKSLASKDLTDSYCDTLSDHLVHAYPFRDMYPEDIYSKYVLNPRVHLEMLHPYRAFVNNYFDDETKMRFAQNPMELYNYINENIVDLTDEDYKTLIATVTGTLRLGRGSKNTKKVLFVSICRTLGVPARCNPHDGELEYFKNGKFVRVTPYEAKETVKLTLKSKDALQYSKNLSISRLVNGEYQTLSLWGNDTCEFMLEEGSYRILTGKRLTDGTMLMNSYYADLVNGRDTILEVNVPEENIMTDTVDIQDHIIQTGKAEVTLSDALAEGMNLVAYTEPSKEPTEHLFKELLQSAEEIRNKKLSIVLIAKGQNQTLNEVMAAFPGAVLIETDDISFAETLLYHFGLPSGSYPVVTLVNKENHELKSLYRTSGYHVGSVDIMLGLI